MSEWARIDWAERTALPELLGVRITKTIHMLDRLRLGRGKDGELETRVLSAQDLRNGLMML